MSARRTADYKLTLLYSTRTAPEQHPCSLSVGGNLSGVYSIKLDAISWQISCGISRDWSIKVAQLR